MSQYIIKKRDAHIRLQKNAAMPVSISLPLKFWTFISSSPSCGCRRDRITTWWLHVASQISTCLMLQWCFVFSALRKYIIDRKGEQKDVKKSKLPTSTNYQNQAMYPCTVWFQSSTPTTPFWNPVDIWLELAWLASSSCRSCSKSACDLRLTRFAFHLAATGIKKNVWDDSNQIFLCKSRFESV